MATVYRPTRAEQETVIRWDREDDVHVWSASPVTWRKLERLAVRETTCQRRVSGRFYGIPVGRFRWGLKRAGAQALGRRVAVQSAA